MESFKNYFFCFFFLGLSIPLLQLIALNAEQKDRVIPVSPETFQAIGTGGIIFALFSGFYFGSIFWSMADAKKRKKPGCLVGFMVAIMPIMGLTLWIIFRPS